MPPPSRMRELLHQQRLHLLHGEVVFMPEEPVEAVYLVERGGVLVFAPSGACPCVPRAAAHHRIARHVGWWDLARCWAGARANKPSCTVDSANSSHDIRGARCPSTPLAGACRCLTCKAELSQPQYARKIASHKKTNGRRVRSGLKARPRAFVGKTRQSPPSRGIWRQCAGQGEYRPWPRFERWHRRSMVERVPRPRSSCAV